MPTGRRPARPTRTRSVAEARSGGLAGVLIDTWDKSSRPSPVDLSWLPLVRAVRRWGGLVALAGGLDEAQIASLGPLGPDLFAVPGAACLGGRREGPSIAAGSSGSSRRPGGEPGEVARCDRQRHRRPELLGRRKALSKDVSRSPPARRVIGRAEPGWFWRGVVRRRGSGTTLAGRRGAFLKPARRGRERTGIPRVSSPTDRHPRFSFRPRRRRTSASLQPRPSSCNESARRPQRSRHSTGQRGDSVGATPVVPGLLGVDPPVRPELGDAPPPTVEDRPWSSPPRLEGSRATLVHRSASSCQDIRRSGLLWVREILTSRRISSIIHSRHSFPITRAGPGRAARRAGGRRRGGPAAGPPGGRPGRRGPISWPLPARSRRAAGRS